MMDTEAPSLVVEQVSRAYRSGRRVTPVIRALSTAIQPAELTLVMGASGSGKSTLLAMMSGLLRPDSGHVSALHTDLWRLSAAQLERFRFAHFGFVFQGFNLFPALTALEQVMMPLKFAGLAAPAMRKAAQEALEEVGLAAHAHLRPMEMSGGEKQRVAIARALAKAPQVLFADEPTSALDSANGQVVIDLLHRIARRHHATVVAVTHDPRLLKHADRILSIEDGRITGDERPRTAQPTAALLAPDSVSVTP